MTVIFDSAGFAIAQVGMRHRALAARLLAEAGVHPGQEFLLAHLWEHDGLAQGDIAARVGVEAPTISRMVQRMERVGLVERRPDPCDGRIQRVWLTQQGRAARPQVEQAWTALEAATLDSLDDNERAALVGLLGRVRSNLQRVLADDRPRTDPVVHGCAGA